MHRLAQQRLAQRPDEGDAPGDGRLEEQVDPRGLRRGEDLRPGVGEQLLVGGHHRLARLQGGEHQLPGRLDAAHDLDDDVDVGIGDDRPGVVGEHVGGQLDVAAAGRVPDGDTGDLEVEPGARRDGGPLAGHEGDERGADGAAAEHADADG